MRDGVRLLLLDGRPLSLPETGDPLLFRTAGLANAVAAEWNRAAHRQTLRPDALPLTRFAFTAAGRVAPDRVGAIGDLLRFAETELLRYRAATPDALVRAEDRAWQPWLDWACSRFDALLPPVVGVMPVELPPEARAALARMLEARSDDALAVLLGIVPLLGSLVLGLALLDGASSPDELAKVALVDHAFQAELWGEQTSALAERERLAGLLGSAVRFLDLAEPCPA